MHNVRKSRVASKRTINAFNERIDEEFGPILVTEKAYPFSSVLFGMDPVGYSIKYAEYRESLRKPMCPACLEKFNDCVQNEDCCWETGSNKALP